MSAVRKLIDELQQVAPTGWSHTGGGCYAIETVLPDGGFLNITDAADVFAADDLDSDDEVTGFCMTRYDANGDLVEPDEHVGEYEFLSDVDADGYSLGCDIDEVVEVARSFVRARRGVKA